MRDIVFIAAVGLSILGLLAFALHETHEAHEKCRSAGGQMVHDGTFIYIWQVTDFKTGAGVLTPYPNYKCVVQK